WDLITSLAFSPDGTLLAVGARDAAVHLWSLTADQELPPLVGHTTPVRGLAFRPGGKQLISVDMELTQLGWNLARLAPPAGPRTPARERAVPRAGARPARARRLPPLRGVPLPGRGAEGGRDADRRARRAGARRRRAKDQPADHRLAKPQRRGAAQGDDGTARPRRGGPRRPFPTAGPEPQPPRHAADDAQALRPGGDARPLAVAGGGAGVGAARHAGGPAAAGEARQGGGGGEADGGRQGGAGPARLADRHGQAGAGRRGDAVG